MVESDNRFYEVVPSEKGLVVKVEKVSDEELSSLLIKDPKVVELDERFKGCFTPVWFQGGKDEPISYVYLTNFVNACVLSVGVSHGIFDAKSCGTFLVHLSNAMRGEKEIASADLGCLQWMTAAGLSKKQLERAFVRGVTTVGTQQSMKIFQEESAKTQLAVMFIPGKELAELKKKVLENLEEGEWLSTYEIVCAIAIGAANKGKNLPETQPFIVTLDSRNQISDEIAAEGTTLLGNPITRLLIKKTLQPTADESTTMQWLPRLAKELHSELRSKVQNKEEVLNSFYSIEALYREGVISNGQDSDRVIRDQGFMLNTWVKVIDWFDLEFGTGEKPQFMTMNRNYLQLKYPRLVQLTPCGGDGSWRLQLGLRAEENKRIVDAVSEVTQGKSFHYIID